MRPQQLIPTLAKFFESGEPVLLVGQPGAGKTDCVKAAADRAGIDYFISHAVIKDPTDYGGLPAIVDGVVDFHPYSDLALMLDADEPLLVFFDDLGQAPEAVQAALMQIILEREINGKAISEHVTFCAATNDATHGAGVAGILEPLKSRFASIINFTIHVDDWVDWAIAQGLDSTLIAFVAYTPAVLTKFKPSRDMTNSPTPRTIAHVGKILNLFPEMSSVTWELITGAAGEGFQTDFFTFMKYMDQMPDPDELLKDPSTFEVPQDLGLVYAILSALAVRVTKKNSRKFGTLLLAIMDAKGDEFGAFGMRFLTGRYGQQVKQWPFAGDIMRRIMNAVAGA